MAPSKTSELATNFTATDLGIDDREVFTDDTNHSIKYRTLSWPAAAVIMITEIVTGGTLTLPQAIAVVGLVPGTIIIVFCGIWALFTSFLLIDFKLNHPEVHNMGDAGFILFSPFGLGAVGREVLSAGTILFAITGVGSMCLLGQLALQTLSQGGMCAMSYLGIWTCITFLVSVPRTFGGGLQGLSVAACISVLVATLVAMIGSGVEPTPNRVVVATAPNSFYTAFLAITNPVLAYAGHFLFFTIISEMKVPRDSKKAAWALQTFSTIWYVVFAVVSDLGESGMGIVLTEHIGRWSPFFSYLGGIVASAFASWYTYGLAGAFWWHDTHHLGDGW
ncbi:transmembrane amino acid transporter, partial [Aureobasidium melanogenum]